MLHLHAADARAALLALLAHDIVERRARRPVVVPAAVRPAFIHAVVALQSAHVFTSASIFAPQFGQKFVGISYRYISSAFVIIVL